MDKIALISNFNIKEKADAAYLVANKILPFCSEILISSQYKDRVFRSRNHRKEFTYMDYDSIFKEADLIIVLGGDGFMLEAARKSSLCNVPMLGINLGRVGYMTELEIDEIDMLENLFRGDYRIDERSMINVEVVNPSGKVKVQSYALNEAVIAGFMSRIVEVDLVCNSKPVSEFRADGLVVSTPTGSTAYSLSAGGPLLDPNIACMCVTPICPYSLVARPMVFSDSSVLEVKNICKREKSLHLTLDGRVSFDLYYGDVVRITRSELVTKLIRLKDEGFYSKVRSKKFF